MNSFISREMSNHIHFIHFNAPNKFNAIKDKSGDCVYKTNITKQSIRLIIKIWIVRRVKWFFLPLSFRA